MATRFLRTRKLVGNVSIRKVVSQVFSPWHDFTGFATYATERYVDVGQPTSLSHPQLLAEGEITLGITCDEYISRRKRLLELLPEKSLAIIASAPVKMMTDVVPYPFRQDADYLYITGCSQPGGVAVLSEECGLCMFMPDPDPHIDTSKCAVITASKDGIKDVAWQGQVAGVEAALDFFKAEKAFPLNKMHKILPEMIGRASRLFHNVKTALPSYMEVEAFRRASLNNKVKDLSRYTHEMRWIKSPSELKLMRESASIACQSLLQTMLLSRTFPEESKLSAKFEYECKMRGAQRMAFNPVVGGGANGSVIHYSRNDQKVRAGELVLMDVGCEFHGYLSDLTRTWPPCSSFSSAQEILYSLILETNKECVKLCKPGVSIQQIHNYSVQMLRRGLKEIGILKDEASYSYHQLNPTSVGHIPIRFTSPNSFPPEECCMCYRCSHYLGMDVHDSAMVSNDRPLQPGVVITIEPGVYIPISYDAPDRFQGIGIRIEDEVLITETGYEVLTGSMPKEIPHIKSLLNFAHSTATEAPNLRAAFS